MRESTQELDTTARYVGSHTKIKTTSSITNANLDLDLGVGGKKENHGRSKHSRVMSVGIFIRTMKTHRKNIHNDIKQFNCIYCNSAYGEKRNLMNHIKRNHPGSELMFRRITPQGEAIMDEKTSLNQVSLSPNKEGQRGSEDKDS